MNWAKYDHLLEHCALIYGTSRVWDGSNGVVMSLPNLAHAHGAEIVRLWKRSEFRRTLMRHEIPPYPSHVAADIAAGFAPIEELWRSPAPAFATEFEARWFLREYRWPLTQARAIINLGHRSCFHRVRTQRIFDEASLDEARRRVLEAERLKSASGERRQT